MHSVTDDKIKHAKINSSCHFKHVKKNVQIIILKTHEAREIKDCNFTQNRFFFLCSLASCSTQVYHILPGYLSLSFFVCTTKGRND